MKKILRSGSQDVEVLRTEEGCEGEETHAFYDPHAASAFLRSLLTDPAGIRALREAMHHGAPYGQLSRLDDHEVLDHVGAQLLYGRSWLGFGKSKAKVLSGDVVTKVAGVTGGGAAAPQGIKPAAVKNWIMFQVVDDATNAPLGNVAIIVKDPTGWLKEYVTDGRGMIEIAKTERGEHTVSDNRDGARLTTTLEFVSAQPGEEIKTPATMLAGAPWKILSVEHHKSNRHESILSLATGVGMTWQNLALFNWDTCIPDEINKHLAEDVGCTYKVDAYNYRFDESDDPGIMYIPADFKESGLEAEQTWIVRVRQPTFEGIPFLYFVDTEFLLPDTEYVIYDGNWNELGRGKSDANAKLDLPEGTAVAKIVCAPLMQITGKVVEADGATAIANQSVEAEYWSGRIVKAQTGGGGEISLADVPKGAVIVRYKSKESVVAVDETTTNVTFKMKATKEELGGGDPDIHEIMDDLEKREREKEPPEEPKETSDIEDVVLESSIG